MIISRWDPFYIFPENESGVRYMFGEGLIAIGNAIGACAWAYAAIYITGFITKTVLLWNLDIEPEQLGDWMDIKIFKERDKIKNKKL